MAELTEEEDLDKGDEASKGVFTNITKMGPLYNRNREHAAGSTTNPNDDGTTGENDPDSVADMIESWQGQSAAYRLTLASSPYRNLASPGSPLHHCYEAATAQEKQNYDNANQAVQEAETKVDQSAATSEDGKPTGESILAVAEARTNAAIAGNNMVLTYGTAAEKKQAAPDSAPLNRSREEQAKTRALIDQAKADGLAHGKTQKEIAADVLRIIKEREPQTFAEMAKKHPSLLQEVAAAPAVTSQVNGAAIQPVVATPVTPVAPVAVKPVTPTTDFNTASLIALGPIIGIRKNDVDAAVVAKDVANFVGANGDILFTSEKDNLDDFNNPLNASLWDAYDNKRELVDKYDAAVAAIDKTSEAAQQSKSPEDFLAYHQAILDRKLAVNDIAFYAAEKSGDTQALLNAQTERYNLQEGQQRLGELQKSLAGKTDAEKTEIMKAAFPPDASKGQTAGIYESYAATGKLDKPSSDTQTASTDYDYLDADYYDYYDDWLLSEGWIDTGDSCAMPGTGIKDPGVNLSQTFLASADPSTQPAGTDPTLQPTAPGQTIKSPAMTA